MSLKFQKCVFETKDVNNSMQRYFELQKGSERLRVVVKELFSFQKQTPSL